MAPTLRSSHATTRCASHEAISHQEWLSYRFNGFDLLAHCDCQSRKAHRSPIKPLDKSNENGSIEAI
jgi:hypothetical protein